VNDILSDGFYILFLLFVFRKYVSFSTVKCVDQNNVNINMTVRNLFLNPLFLIAPLVNVVNEVTF
jgi:hypothetical protein